MNNYNPEVTQFIEQSNHPLLKEIELLRSIILKTSSDLKENIKWNGPNYIYKGEDRITMKINPPKQIQLIFHCGAKKLEQPKNRLISSTAEFLVWKENDRAMGTFKTSNDILNQEIELKEVIVQWLKANL